MLLYEAPLNTTPPPAKNCVWRASRQLNTGSLEVEQSRRAWKLALFPYTLLALALHISSIVLFICNFFRKLLIIIKTFLWALWASLICSLKSCKDVLGGNLITLSSTEEEEMDFDVGNWRTVLWHFGWPRTTSKQTVTEFYQITGHLVDIYWRMLTWDTRKWHLRIQC